MMVGGAHCNCVFLHNNISKDVIFGTASTKCHYKTFLPVVASQ